MGYYCCISQIGAACYFTLVLESFSRSFVSNGTLARLKMSEVHSAKSDDKVIKVDVIVYDLITQVLLWPFFFFFFARLCIL
jgi:hypothetical protein